MNPIQKTTTKYPWLCKLFAWVLLIGLPVFLPVAAVLFSWQDMLKWIATPFIRLEYEIRMWIKGCWEEIKE